MKTIHLIAAMAAIAAGVGFIITKSPPASWLVAGLCWSYAGYALSIFMPSRSRPIVRLKGLKWNRYDFCRGWLITGDTGSGKTRSGINHLLYQVFQNEPNWGGIAIDDKGVYWETLVAMARHFNREKDLILLQVRPDNAPADWQPVHTYNLISDPAIPYATYGKFVVDTASSLGQQGDKAFFRNQAQVHIARALETLHETGSPVTLEEAYTLLLNNVELRKALETLGKQVGNKRHKLLVDHFQTRYLYQPAEQLGGVKETIANYLQNFLSPDISQVFCADKNSFSLADIDRGKIICVSMPQKYQTERRYVNTFLKMLFYTHVLRRFDLPAAERHRRNLLILWADEAQHFMTASEEGMSDYNVIDVLREANATIVAAAQSSTSFVPPLGAEKAKVLLLNLRNRIIFKAADGECALASAEFLGKKKALQKSWGFTAGKRTCNYTEIKDYRIDPHELRLMPKHKAVLVHCERGFRKVFLPPIEPDGKVSAWYKWRWFRWLMTQFGY